MKYAHLVSAFFATPWAITAAKYAEIRRVLEIRAAGGQVPEHQIEAAVGQRRDDDVVMYGRVAVLPVQGTICQRCSLFEQASGGVSCEQIGATLDNLCADRGCKAIVMAFDSPGGSVFGVPELAARIRACRADKKIVAFADPMAASAAYWLATQCEEIYCTPSGTVGSIGVITSHDDISEALKMAGIKTTLVTSAKFKAEGYPEMPLDDDALGEMQAKVDAYHAQFVADVAKGRGVSEARVNKDFGQGRLLLAQQALAAGMCDKITTLDKLLKSLGADLGPAAAAGAALPKAEDETKDPTFKLREAQALARARAVQVQDEN